MNNVIHEGGRVSASRTLAQHLALEGGRPLPPVWSLALEVAMRQAVRMQGPMPPPRQGARSLRVLVMTLPEFVARFETIGRERHRDLLPGAALWPELVAA